jgi:hypothetical protein
MGHVEGLAGAVARHAQFLTARQFSTIGRKRLVGFCQRLQRLFGWRA